MAGGGGGEREGKVGGGANGDVGFCVSGPRFSSFQSLGLSGWRIWMWILAKSQNSGRYDPSDPNRSLNELSTRRVLLFVYLKNI